jgi:hypothetical protein
MKKIIIIGSIFAVLLMLLMSFVSNIQAAPERNVSIKELSKTNAESPIQRTNTDSRICDFLWKLWLWHGDQFALLKIWTIFPLLVACGCVDLP